MREEIFLSYANLPLIKENPEGLFEFSNVVKQRFPNNAKHFTAMVKGVSAAFELTTAARADRFMEKMKDRYPKEFEDPFVKLPFENAVETLFAFRGGFCESKCVFGRYRREVLGEGLFKGEGRITCLDCDHLFFKRMFGLVASGKIEECRIELESFLGYGAGMVKKIVRVARHRKRNALGVAEGETLFFSSPLLVKSDAEGRTPFRKRVAEIVSFSLGDFLVGSEGRNIEKINKCQHCGLFFAGKNFNKRKYCDVCSGKSKMSKEERRVYMAKRRKKQKSDELESMIKGHMSLLKISRGEAIALIEADKSM